MCGRYTLRLLDVFLSIGEVAEIETFDEKRIVPRFNVAPSQQVAIVRLKDQQRILSTAAWGFVPFFLTGKPKMKPINAKSETVATSGMFRQAFKSSRCLLPADGFFEWQDGTPKTPYFFHRPDDKPFAFAGLFSRRGDGNTCLLLTTTPNEIVRPVHDRMPVMLDKEEFAIWLDPESPPDELLALLRPFPEADLIGYAVSQHVNKPANDDAGCIKPA